jgi:ubiquinone/menaquinone biosynthesis C-methylase UbiE
MTVLEWPPERGVALGLLRQPKFKGRVIGVDRSPGMLRVADQEAAGLGDRAFFILADAMALPFADNCVPAVTSLEAMDFMPNPTLGLQEMVRVLQPQSSRQTQPGLAVDYAAGRLGGSADARQNLDPGAVGGHSAPVSAATD